MYIYIYIYNYRPLHAVGSVAKRPRARSPVKIALRQFES